MQVKPQEVSADKAITPAEQVLRPANGKARRYVVKLKDLHMLGSIENGEACICVVPVADHDFVLINRLADQNRIRTLENAAHPLLESEPAAVRWTHDKPTTTGAYWVRGFRIGEPDSRPALVEVALNDDGALLCNIHEHNTNDETHQWSFVSDCAERFEWCGPLQGGAA